MQKKQNLCLFFYSLMMFIVIILLCYIVYASIEIGKHVGAAIFIAIFRGLGL